MLMPKRTKFRKMQKGRVTGLAQRGARVDFGDFGIKSLEVGWITSRQIEAARIAMTRRMKRVGKVWIRIFPDKPITKKPAETRMGKGKGAPEHFVAVVKPGRVLFEVGGVSEELAREAMALAMQKLPVKTRFVVRPDFFTVAPPSEDAEPAGAEAAGAKAASVKPANTPPPEPDEAATVANAADADADAADADAAGAATDVAVAESTSETEPETNE